MSETTFERVRRVLLSVRSTIPTKLEVLPDTVITDYFGLYDGAEFFVDLCKEFENEFPETNLVLESHDCQTLQELADFIDKEKSQLVTQGE